MKPARAWLILVLVLSALPVFAQQVVYVDDSCLVPPGLGTPTNPFCAIQDGMAAVNSGGTVIVLPGTYKECVFPYNGPVNLLAQDYELNGRNNTTIIDGTGLCDAAPLQSAITLIGGSLLRGFTVRGGGYSGVSAFGSVTISRNVVEGNGSVDFGGGIWVDTSPAYGGTGSTSVDGNQVSGNAAASGGGGIFVYGRTSDAPQSIQIADNIVSNNSAVDFGGGILVTTETSSISQVTVVVTRNTIEGNSTPGNAGTTGFGAGMYAGTYGTGTETIRVESNTIRNNVAARDGGGLSAWMRPAVQGLHTVWVKGNTVDGNQALGGGGGLDLYLEATAMPAESVLDFSVENNIVTNNSLSGITLADGDGGGGVLAYMYSTNTTAPGINFRVQGNTIQGNSTGYRGGGASLISIADAFDGTTTAAARIRFARNLVVQNQSVAGTGTASGGGVYLLTESFGQALARGEIDFNTIAGNKTSGVGAGGVLLESLTLLDTGGTKGGSSQIVLSDSIVSNNEGYGVALEPADPSDVGGLSLAVKYNDVFGSAVAAFRPPLLPPPVEGNISADPLFAPSTYAPLACSPTIDAGDPTASFAAEPEPNGGRANLGYLGGTSQTAATFADLNADGKVDVFDVLPFAVSFASTPTDLDRWFPKADLDGNKQIDGTDLSGLTSQFGTSCP